MGQQYDGLHIEKMKIDANNTIYQSGRTFVYSYELIINDTTYQLENTLWSGNISKERFKLSSDLLDTTLISEIHLTVTKPKLGQRTNKNQTEVFHIYEPNSTMAYHTGIVENESNVWLHPFRAIFFEALETCPFPYIKLDKHQGEQWNDSMSIGSFWSHEMWGVWEGRLLLKYTYEIAENLTLPTKIGPLDCIKVIADASSKIGNSELIAFYSPEYGFVKLNYTLFNGIQISFNLEEVLDGPIYRDGRDFFRRR